MLLFLHHGYTRNISLYRFRICFRIFVPNLVWKKEKEKLDKQKKEEERKKTIPTK